MKEGTDFSGVTHYTQVDVQPGGINIQHVENLYQADILKQLGIELEVKGKGECTAECTAEPTPLCSQQEVKSLRLRDSILQLQAEDVLKRKGDWGLLMTAMVQTDDLPDFDNTHSFAEYMTGTLHIDGVPSESCIDKMVRKIRGSFPNWTFTDTTDTTEVNRRVNVGRRLVSSYRKQQ